MASELKIRMAVANDISLIELLAHKIWPFAYKDILTQDELQYMLRVIYSPESLLRQMEQHHQFLIAELADNPVGFASYSLLDSKGVFKLQKLYVLPELHGKGLGKALLDFITEEITSRGATKLRLNMNRHNKAKTFYEKNGFSIIGEEDVDIGNNYFMNDYVMEKNLTYTV